MHTATFFRGTGLGIIGFAVFMMVGKQTVKFNAAINE